MRILVVGHRMWQVQEVAEEAGAEVVVAETLQEVMKALEAHNHWRKRLDGALVEIGLPAVDPDSRPAPIVDLGYDGPDGPYRPVTFYDPNPHDPTDCSMYAEGAPNGLYAALLCQKMNLPFVLYEVGGKSRKSWDWPKKFAQMAGLKLQAIRPSSETRLDDFLRKIVKELMAEATKK